MPRENLDWFLVAFCFASDMGFAETYPLIRCVPNAESLLSKGSVDMNDGVGVRPSHFDKIGEQMLQLFRAELRIIGENCVKNHIGVCRAFDYAEVMNGNAFVQLVNKFGKDSTHLCEFFVVHTYGVKVNDRNAAQFLI